MKNMKIHWIPPRAASCRRVKPILIKLVLHLLGECFCVASGFVPLLLTMENGLHEGIWDPEPRVTNTKGTNSKSLISALLTRCLQAALFSSMRDFTNY